jgi:hypothetical protein
MADQSLPARGTAAQTRHIRLGRRFVEEDKPGRVDPSLTALPAPAGPRDIRPVLFRRMERLFLYVRSMRANTQWIAPIVQFSPRRCLISASVRSGSCATTFLSAAPCLGSSFALRPQYRYRARKSPVRFLWASSFFTSPTDTLKRFATSSRVPSCAS